MTDRSFLFAGIAGYVGRPGETGATGVFRRTVGDSAWQHVLADLETHVVHVHADKPNVVLAGTEDGVWRSTDHGATFSRTSFPDKNKQIWSFLVDQSNKDRILAGASPIDVYTSDDCGATWRKLPTPAMPEHCKVLFNARVMRMVQSPNNPDELFAALEVNGVMRSNNFGESWEDISGDLIRLSDQPHLQSKIVSDTFSEGMLDAHAITISPARPNDIILALRMGLFRSQNQGDAWSDMQVGRFAPTTYARDIKSSPQDPKTLYAALSVAAASHDGGVYRSLDAGDTWQRFDNVEVNGTIMSVSLHPHDEAQVYIGARYNGEIYGTRDGGESWEDLSIPGSVKDVYCLSCG